MSSSAAKLYFIRWGVQQFSLIWESFVQWGASIYTTPASLKISIVIEFQAMPLKKDFSHLSNIW